MKKNLSYICVIIGTLFGVILGSVIVYNSLPKRESNNSVAEKDNNSYSDMSLEERLMSDYEAVEALNNLATSEDIKSGLYDNPDLVSENGTYYINYPLIIAENKIDGDYAEYLNVCDIVQRSGKNIEGQYNVLDACYRFTETYPDSEYVSYCKDLISVFKQSYFGIDDLFCEDNAYFDAEVLDGYKRVSEKEGKLSQLTAKYYQTIVANKGQKNANVLAAGFTCIKEIENQ